MKTKLPTWRSVQSMQGAIAKETIRSWLLGRSRVRVPLPDFDQLRADIQTYAHKNWPLDHTPSCDIDATKR
jgi:hypothetical protein